MTVQPFIDAHLHANSRSAEDFQRLRLVGCQGVVAVAGAEGGFSSAESVLDFFRRLARVDRPRIEAAGLRCFLALGVHPRGIPARGLDDLLEALPRTWKDLGAAAVGEIGLEAGTPREKELFRRQLTLAALADLPVVVHTPRENKLAVLRATLEAIADCHLEPRRVLLDHLDGQTLEVAESSGCWLGLSLHPAKLSPAEAARLARDRGGERLVLSTDMGAWPSYLFGIPAALAAMAEAGVPADRQRRLAYQNALDFLAPTP